MVRAFVFGLLGLAAVSRLVISAPAPDADHLWPSLGTCNTPTNRACWKPGFDINFDYETTTPVTGNTRKYTLTITEHEQWVGPDGHVKEVAMLVNNQLPGPTIVADWGDVLEITVVNKLKNNGTSIHWHGIRQLNSNTEDGVNGVTECPIPPGRSRVYRFLATQYGTSWYHSHFEVQLGNGVFGTMQVNGPASAPYDVDLGVFPMHDWYWDGADAILSRVMSRPGGPPASDNLLFNGTNVNPSPGRGVGGPGKYAVVTVVPGKKHRLRLINLSVENAFVVSIVGHSMTVISTDWVPVKPYAASSVFLNVGQRYDVVVDADADAGGNFWINATFSSTGACGASNNTHPAAILRYADAPDALPTDPGTAPPDSLCQDFTGFEPVVPRVVPRHDPVPNERVSVDVVTTTNNGSAGATSVFWRVNQSAIDVSWGRPTLEYISQGNASYPTRLNVITIADENRWTYFVVQNLSPVSHPMHLHGHDFAVLGHSAPPATPFASPVVNFTAADVDGLRWDNPTRRDVTTLPADGWLVLAHRNDNPGAWLFHCHIAWHLSQGLSVQFVEQARRIPDVMRLDRIEPNCDAWRRYAPTDPFPKMASGLR